MILSFISILMGQEGGNAPDFGILSDLFITAPFAAVMLWLFLDERKERRSLQSQLIEMINKVLPALEKSNEALDEVVTTLDEHIDTNSGERKRTTRKT